MRIETHWTPATWAGLLLTGLSTTVCGQYYSEQMRLSGGAAEEPLTLQQVQADVAEAPPAPLAFSNPNARAAAPWTYKAEPHLDSLPPHLTRFLGMLLYYTNGTVFVVYTNPEALHHQKGIRAGDRILSVNGKSIGFYKDSFFDELNEVRPDRDLQVHYETGTPAYQKILILPNIALPDRNLEKLLMAMRRSGGPDWPVAREAPRLAEPGSHAPSAKPVRHSHFKPSSVSPPRAQQPNGRFQHFGISAQQQQGRMVVDAVRPRSAAASAKIQPGDEILAISQQRAGTLSAEAIRQLVAAEPVLIDWLPRGSRSPERGYFNSSPK